MRFGVPDAKLEKWMIDRRVDAARGRGDRVRVRRRRRRRRRRGRARRRQRRGRDRDRLAGRARPRGPGPRARRRPLRDGLPLPAQPLGRRVAGARGARARRRATEITAAGKHVVVIGGGDTGHGLHLERQPRGRALGHPARRLPRAALERPLPRHALAAGAEALVHHLRPRRGRRAPLRPPGDRARGRRRPGQRAGRAPGHRQLLARRSSRSPAASSTMPGRPGADRDRLPAPGARRRRRRARGRASTAAATSPRRPSRPPAPASTPPATPASGSR